MKRNKQFVNGDIKKEVYDLKASVDIGIPLKILQSYKYNQTKTILFNVLSYLHYMDALTSENMTINIDHVELNYLDYTNFNEFALVQNKFSDKNELSMHRICGISFLTTDDILVDYNSWKFFHTVFKVNVKDIEILIHINFITTRSMVNDEFKIFEEASENEA